MSDQTWFMTGGWRGPIEPVCVVKVSDKTVTVRSEVFRIGGGEAEYVDNRRDKRSQRENFFATWEAAHEHVLNEAAQDLQCARVALHAAQGRFGNIKGLKPPATPSLMDPKP